MIPKGVIRIASGGTPDSIGEEFASALKTLPVAKPAKIPKATPKAGMNIKPAILILFRKMPFWSMPSI